VIDENLLYTFTFLNLADISTTIAALKRGGYEANPIARWFLSKFGVAGLFLFKYLAMGGVILYALLTGNPELGINTADIILSAVVAWNSYVLLSLSKREK
jgi:hypothetical protein